MLSHRPTSAPRSSPPTPSWRGRTRATLTLTLTLTLNLTLTLTRTLTLTPTLTKARPHTPLTSGQIGQLVEGLPLDEQSRINYNEFMAAFEAVDTSHYDSYERTTA